MLELNREARSFSYSASGCAIDPWWIVLEADGVPLHSARADIRVMQDSPLKVFFSFPGTGLEWEVRAETDAPRGTVPRYGLRPTGALRAVASITLDR